MENTQEHGNQHFTINADSELTEIICVIDRSTSIKTSGLIERTIEGFNAFLAEQKKLPGKAKLTLCLFDGGMGFGNTGKDGETYEIVHAGIDINEVPELNNQTFVPKGMTAMYDAIGFTIDATAKRLADVKDKPKVVFLIMTDGEENSSKEYTQKAVFDLIKKHEDQDDWAFVFIGANIDTMKAGGGMGVSMGNTMSYLASQDGVHTAFASMSSGVTKLRSMSKMDASYKMKASNLMSDDDVKKDDDNTKESK